MSSDLTFGDNIVSTNSENQFGQSNKSDEIFDDASLNLFDFADPVLTNNNQQFLSQNTNDSTNCNNGMMRNDDHASAPQLAISNQQNNENTKNVNPSESKETAKNKKAKENTKKRKKEPGNDGAVTKATKRKRKYDPNAQFKRKNIK